MERPTAFKLTSAEKEEVYRVRIDPDQSRRFKPRDPSSMPAVIVTRAATILPAVSAGMVDASDVLAVVEGNWSEAVLVVLSDKPLRGAPVKTAGDGDSKFLMFVEQTAPSLAELATETLRAIRSAGVDGELIETKLGRWMNKPLNTFTLKPQPRVGNLQFTLYGNPETYTAGDFLRKDQNSYSRGWVRSPADVQLLAELAQQSHNRRKR